MAYLVSHYISAECVFSREILCARIWAPKFLNLKNLHQKVERWWALLFHRLTDFSHFLLSFYFHLCYLNPCDWGWSPGPHTCWADILQWRLYNLSTGFEVLKCLGIHTNVTEIHVLVRSVHSMVKQPWLWLPTILLFYFYFHKSSSLK